MVVGKVKDLRDRKGEDEFLGVLIELVSIMKRIYVYFIDKNEGKNTKKEVKEGLKYIESCLDDLILLLKVENGVLLLCVIELIINMLGFKHNRDPFRSPTSIESILLILTSCEETEVKKRVLYLLIELVQDEEIVEILKEHHVLEILANQIEQTRLISIHNEGDDIPDEATNIKIGFWDCLKALSMTKHDILPEFRRLHIIGTLLDELEMSKNPFQQMSLIEILINLCMDDQNAVQIRECGVHIIGRELLYTADCIDENDPSLQILLQNGTSESEFKIGLKQIINELQQLSLILLRFLYSVQKNRKLFRLVFPPEIFGPFIDIGNYERNREKYKLVKKINRLPESTKSTIMANFEKIRDISSGIIENQKSINGFNIIDIIGKGAFGIVYEVEKEGQRYAMKKIDIAQYDHTYEQNKLEEMEEGKRDFDAQVSEKISKEISILKGVDHPNVIKFYTSFVENDSVYIIMELHEGLSLADYIQSLSEKKQKVKEEVAWNIFFQLCSALRYLHYDMKILHRDFAPSNILLDENFTVKLIDFGLATKWGTQSASAQKSFVGTILYSCPEMVQNKKCTVKADVWSLGAIMYELLTLEQPFKGDNPLLIANKIVKCTYEPIPEGEYSQDLIDAVKKCMTVETKKRPNVVDLCSSYTSYMMKQMDQMKQKEISLINKLKVMEHHRGGHFSKLSNTHAVDLHYTTQYNSASPIGKNLEMITKTGGFEANKKQFKLNK